MKIFKKLEQFDPKNNAKKPHPMQFAMLVILIVLVLALSLYFHHKKATPIPYPEKIVLQHISPAATHLAPWKTLLVKPNDNLLTLFKRAKLSKEVYYEIIQLPDAKKYLKYLIPKQTLQLQINKKNELLGLHYAIDQQKTLVISKQKDKYVSKIIITPLIKKMETTSGKIESSLFNAIHKTGLSDRLLMQFTNIFDNKINFRSQIRAGDKFKIIYEVYFSHGKPVKIGNIIAAEFITRHKVYDAIRYQTQNGHINYYTPLGKNLHNAFLRTPVKYTRISSRFNSRRMHPILHIIRPHEGIDFAAPIGTPIKAGGDGMITFRGRRGGYGKAIIIQHGRKYSTLYGHMSHFSSRFHIGSHVKEGQIIGYVGETGMATGPHLHYEFRINGIHYNPLTVRLPNAKSIPPNELHDFSAYAQVMVHRLDEIAIT